MRNPIILTRKRDMANPDYNLNPLYPWMAILIYKNKSWISTGETPEKARNKAIDFWLED